MDECNSTPQVFANKVIKQFVQHILADDMVIEPEDYMVIRTVYRWAGGTWDKLGDGDVVMLNLLQKIIGAWGQMPERVKDSDRVI